MIATVKRLLLASGRNVKLDRKTETFIDGDKTPVYADYQSRILVIRDPSLPNGQAVVVPFEAAASWVEEMPEPAAKPKAAKTVQA